MPRRIAQSSLNASTIDILNVIRQNASLAYQSSVPAVQTANDIPVVGEVIYGTPAFANEFINALVNRIALVRVNSATFNNPYASVKKGLLEFGETVEEIFVNIAKVRDFSAEKAPQRELARTLPDVRSAFHVMNWNVQYPVTIQDEDLRLAFTSMDGVQNLIAKIVDSVYTAAEYDDFLLVKYMLIKAIAHGEVKPVAVDTSAIKNSAVAFRGTSNMMTFMRSDYNEAGVQNTTPKDRQLIFLDAMYDAQFDVDVLASAFNMDKAEYMGRRHLIDDWTTFDNERFEYIRSQSDGIEEVTAAELALLADVIGVLVDEEWFQIYDNLRRFTENYIGSGMYWNYWYNVRETISHSPFHNAVVFVKNTATTAAPATLTFTVASISEGVEGTHVVTLEPDQSTASLVGGQYSFVQTEAATGDGIAIQKYGAIIFPNGEMAVDLLVSAYGEEYAGSIDLEGDSTADPAVPATVVGDTITLTKQGN